MPAAMDAQAVSALAQRLSRDPELVLPGSMTRPDAPPISDGGKVQYVSGLLQHDPGVFLERLGDKLDAAELASFEPLRSDYEVDFYLRQLQPASQTSPVQEQAADGDGAAAQQAVHTNPPRREPSRQRRLLAATKNRRLAQLQRLMDRGDYFSDDAMRTRAPLLHHHYVAQYRPAALPVGSKSLADSMLANYDEAVIHSRLAAEREREDMIELDEESEDEAMPEDRRAEVEQPRPTPADADAAAAQRQPLQLPAGTPPVANAALATAASVAIRLEAADQRAALKAQRQREQDAAAAPAEDRKGGAAVPTQPPGSEGPAGAAADSRAEPARDQGEAEDAGDDAEGGAPEQEPYVHIPEDERQQLANDFLELMQAKFLGGEDAEVDYAKIDADASLDDDFSGLARQDAEDLYFAD